MRPAARAAVVLVACLLGSCSGSLVDGEDGPGRHPDLEAPGSARLEVLGEHEAVRELLAVWSAGFVLGRTADAAAEKFQRLEVLPVAYRSPDDQAVARITRKELHVRLDRTSFRASLDDCEVATRPGASSAGAAPSPAPGSRA